MSTVNGPATVPTRSGTRTFGNAATDRPGTGANEVQRAASGRYGQDAD